MTLQTRIPPTGADTDENKIAFVNKILAEAEASGMSLPVVLNALFVTAANLIVHVTPEHSDYVPVRSFRQVLESIRKQFKAAKESKTNG